MSYLWVAVGQAQGRGRLRELADDSDKNWIATPKGRKRKKPDGTWQYDYTKPGTGKKAAVAKQPAPKAARSKTMKKEQTGTGEVEKQVADLYDRVRDGGRISRLELDSALAAVEKLPFGAVRVVAEKVGVGGKLPFGAGKKFLMARIEEKILERHRHDLDAAAPAPKKAVGKPAKKEPRTLNEAHARRQAEPAPSPAQKQEVSRAIFDAVGNDPVVDISELRSKMPSHLQGRAFDDAVIDLLDSQEAVGSQDVDATNAKPGHIRDGDGVLAYLSLNRT